MLKYLKKITKRFKRKNRVSTKNNDTESLLRELVAYIRNTPISDVITQAQQNFSKYDISNLQLPIQSGRISKEYFLTNNTEITNNFIQFFGQLDAFSIYNADVSHTVWQRIQLASTELTYTFDSSVPDRTMNRMHKALENLYTSIYKGRGVQSFMDDILNDLIVFGAISVEAEINNPLSQGIKEFVKVEVSTVRWVYTDGEYVVYQLDNTGQKNVLNPITYTYLPLLADSKGVYGVPMLLPAIPFQALEVDMLNSFATVVKRFGVLGLATVMLKNISNKEDTESDEAYQNRISFILNETANQIDQNLAKGLLVGSSEDHDISLQGNNINSSGLDAVFDTFDTYKSSALKTSPAMLGREMTSTDTFGRVVLEINSKTIQSMQEKLTQTLDRLGQLHLRLLGFRPAYYSTLKHSLSMPTLRDKLKEAQAEGVKTDTIIKQRDAGFISNNQAAQQLGYDSAYQPDPQTPQQTPQQTEVTNDPGESRTDD